MSSLDEFYEEKYEMRQVRKQAAHDEVIKEFESLSLEEKVNKLIDIYAWDRVNNL